MMFSGWVNRRQVDVLEYLKEENRILKERLGGRRIQFTDAERSRLARKASALGRRVLNELETLVTPDTLMRWYRNLILKAHWECVAATDFFTVEVCTGRGLVTFYVLFFLDLASRTVKIAGVTANPGAAWMTQIARNLTDPEEGFLRRTRYLILDRDTKYSDAFRGFLVREGIYVIRLPPQLLQNSGTFACVGGAVRRRQRLGGMLSFYHRAAA
jgi:hypothetical protein